MSTEVDLIAFERLATHEPTANKVTACGPLGIQTTLLSAHLAIDSTEEVSFSKLGAQYGGLYRTHDFIECLTAQAQGRAPIFHGN